MKDIAILIPIHKINGNEEQEMLNKAISSVNDCQTNCKCELHKYVILGSECNDLKLPEDCTVLRNDGETDFCSQINYGAKNVTEEYFSILEFDDEYNPKWFSMLEKYYYTHEDVSVFLPINVDVFNGEGYRQFANEAPWAMQFSQELGFIDFKCLDNYYGVNLTGGVFNREDFIRVGGIKSSIQVAFNYEFLLRVTNKKLKVYVVPKEGYRHLIGRNGSLMSECSEKFTQEENDKWFALAKEEYLYDEDRKIDIYTKSEDK